MKPGTQLEILFFAGLALQGAGVYILAGTGPALVLTGTEIGVVALWGLTRIALRGASPNRS